MPASATPAAGTRIHAEVVFVESLGRSQHRGVQARSRSGEETECNSSAEVFERQRRGTRNRDEWVRTVDRDKGEVAGGRCDEGRSERVARQIVLVRNLEREHRTRCRCLEDGGDAGRGARDQEGPSVPRREGAREAALQRVAERCPEIHRRAFEAHRRAAAERCDTGDHARREGPKPESVVFIVEGVQVLVGRFR